MSRSISGFLIAEGSNHFSRPACLDCCRQKDCPYSCSHAVERALHQAASQGETAAQLLTAEARRLLEAISCADSIHHLLSTGESLEYMLFDILHTEIVSMQGVPLRENK